MSFSYYQHSAEIEGLSGLDLWPNQEALPFTVTGVAPDGAPSHYDIQDSLKAAYPDVIFDSEAGTFFAYARDEQTAQALTLRLNQAYGPTAVVALSKSDLGVLLGLLQSHGNIFVEADSLVRRKLEAAADEIMRAEHEAR